MTKQAIVSRWNSTKVLFECELPEGLESGLAVRHALEAATKARADLRGADLRGADLRGAYLSGADLSGAYLSGADLSGAAASDEQAAENLDKVRAIVLDNKARLDMGHWHQTEGWRERTCAEETMCETTHCLAGWLQVCSTDEKVRQEPSPQMAGILAAPIASKMFFRKPDEVLTWLDERKYVTEMAERTKRREERAAAKATEAGSAA